MSRVTVDLKLYPGEHHSLRVQDGVLTLSADVQAVWDCIESAGLEDDLIEERITALSDEISELEAKVEELSGGN